ncbi:response regulator [Pseudomonas fildesensis]|uniref:hybrid sensor histidine kinase/response regulator n=1 Tax=Pseudomonas fildesensis TaxID=1674920 RepID=UPI00387B4F43
MKNASLKFGVFALSSQRINKLLLVLAGLTVLLVSMCYWAVERVLDEERIKVDFHFSGLIESIHEYDTFLRSVASAYDRSNQNMLTNIRPLSRVEILQKGQERVFQNHGLALSQPFTLSERKHYDPEQLQGGYSLGVQLTDYYSAFWASSFYSAPQIFLFSPSDQFNIAIPGVDGTRKQSLLLKNNFFDVTAYLYQGLLARHEQLNNRRVSWMRAPRGLLQGTETIVAFIGVDVNPLVMPDRRDDGLLTVAALLDAGQINDLDRLLTRPIDHRVTLISPAGDVLLGDAQGSGSLPVGMSLGAEGLRFKVVSTGKDQWVGLYTISYENFFRFAKWSLLGTGAVFLLAVFLGWRINRWYRAGIVEPALRATRLLTESEEFNRAMLQSAPVGLCVVQRNNSKVLLENQRAQEWQGSAELIDLLNRDYQDEDPREMQIEVAGRHLLVSFRFSRYQGEDVVLCGFNDITRHVDDALLMEQAKRSADEASAAKTLFLATMSHEIRTPLYGVLGNLELLGLTHLDARQQDYLQTIERSSAVLFQLISDVLDVSKIESGQMALETVTFSPLDVFEDAVNSYAAAALNKGLQVFACVDANLPALMSGDPGRIRQILNNLLSNAIKFTDSGRVIVRLKVTDLELNHATLQWQVSDTGAGISEKQLGQLFKPFSQLGGSQQAGGAGLGLSICSRLSELMDAQLRVVSEPGLGSSFSLHQRLPIVPGPLPDCSAIELQGLAVYVRAPFKELEQSLIDWLNRWGARAVALPAGYQGDQHELLLDRVTGPGQQSVWNGRHITATELGARQGDALKQAWTVNAYDIRGIARTLSQARPGGVKPLGSSERVGDQRLGLRVLVAEDNPINRAILQEQLEALGAWVVAAEDGEEALQRWSPGAFDLVITDINMPRLDGYGLARALRERDRQTPIIGVTANALREEGEQCLAAGMDTWVVKPLSLDALRKTLLRYCGERVDKQHEASTLQQGDLDGWITLSATMHRLFITTMQDDVRLTRQGLDAGDKEHVVRHLHRMNGSLASIRASRLSAACNALEEALYKGSLNPSLVAQVRNLLQRLEAVMDAMALNPSSQGQPSDR